MKRLALAAAALVAIASPVAAQQNCAKDYKDFWSKFNNGPAKDLGGDQLAIVHRNALRAFDACSAGDEASAKSIFTRLQDAAPAKGADFWKQLGESAPAKK